LSRYSGPEADLIIPMESGGWYARRAMHWMALSGVCERHPNLKLVLTEQPGDWWPSALAEMDSIYAMQAKLHPELRERVPRPPSEYCAANVFVGASFLAHHEALAAWRGGYADRILWGSDYPHVEGTFQFPGSFDEESLTRQSLRFTFAGLPGAGVRSMAGGNAAAAYGLDYARLTEVAARIGAPTYGDLATPLDRIPDGGGLLAFRTHGTWD
jgi:predicted TIM-barrel fold metal-dependent hydrolase